MSLLADIRAAGGVVELAASGGLSIRSTPAELVELAKQHKSELLVTLRAEALDGMRYTDSRYYPQLDRLYMRAKSLMRYPIVSDECGRLVALCREIDEVMWGSYSDGVALFERHRQTITDLSDSVAQRSGYLLAGARLRAAAVEEMELALAPKLNMAALD